MKCGLSIVIPAYNEQENIGNVIEKIKETTPSDTEIIVIDDGSTDNTAEMAKKKGARVLRHPRNMGKGVSVREGIILAEADKVVFIDWGRPRRPV